MSRKLRRNLSVLLIGISLLLITGCQSTTDLENIAVEKKIQEQDVTQETVKEVDYEKKLFDTSYVHTIDIEIAESDWKDLKENPLDKTKYQVNVTIDGEKIEDVSFATKGNTSLSSVASDNDSDRYSYKLNFGKFVDGQTYYGLDKLNLNNIYADATYMKDYMSYEIFKEAGVAAPLTSYVFITVNGEAVGLYLAIEEIGESYLERTRAGEGDLYKVETEQLNNAGGMKMPMPPNGGQMRENGEMPMPPNGGQMGENGEMPIPPNGGQRGPGGGFGESSKGASLSYTDDKVESYTDIFNNAETEATEEDMARVITALKNLSEGDIEKALDTEEIIKYFVAHNFVLNYDSYTGNMLHNFYLYENEGKLSMLPWDYNLAYGAFGGNHQPGKKQGEEAEDKKQQPSIKSEKQGVETETEGGSGATELINTAIDTPLSGASEEDRPMWSWIVNNQTYLDTYHEYYDKLIKNYFLSGKFEAEIQRVYEMILPYVEKDPTAFYSVDEFKKGYETLKQFCLLRAQSIEKQLNGTLGSTSLTQNSEAFIDASSINIEDMGRQNMGMPNKR